MVDANFRPFPRWVSGWAIFTGTWIRCASGNRVAPVFPPDRGSLAVFCRCAYRKPDPERRRFCCFARARPGLSHGGKQIFYGKRFYSYRGDSVGAVIFGRPAS
jgi:hypothetical protein